MIFHPSICPSVHPFNQSDVWAFGVVLWEIFSFGLVPYVTMSNEEVVHKVLSGYQMLSPHNCPSEVYALMVKCWNLKATSRPTFKELFDALDGIHP